jgi:hypothetical protein
MLRVISLGAGVQSTTMALMAAAGEIGPMPDAAIFADTGAEPEAVYRQLEWLMEPGRLPFPVHVVNAGNIREDILVRSGRTRFAAVPFFIRKVDGGQAMARRQCTREYKIDPIRRKQRELLGYRPRQRIPANSVEVWIGISTDEIQRTKDAKEKWQTNRWPLIEKGMSRKDCLRWIEERGFPPPPKSACTFCPFRDNAGWRDMRENDPTSWEDACMVDDAIRGPDGVHLKFVGTPFLHRSLKPLREAPIEPKESKQLDFGFEQDCDGLCGV